MTANQVQIRRDTSGNLAATTPALGELGYETTNKRLIIGDGSTMGGIPHANYLDVQKKTFNKATAGGTANALTATLSPSPASYGAGLSFYVAATATNTGSTTIDVNGLGTKNILKMTSAGLANLVASDIVTGGVYHLYYDGTQFQLTTVFNSGITSVSQGDLNTATGTFSQNVESANAIDAGANFIVLGNATSHITLPGGQYGFSIESRTGSNGVLSGWLLANDAESYLSAAIPFAYQGSPSAQSVLGQQRYITSSPPFDLGDGDAQGFFFAMLDSSGAVVSTYIADVPPWGYNGPTDIRATRCCQITGKKFQKYMEPRTIEEIMDGASIVMKEREITQKIKNADMDLIPHPFGAVPAGHSVVMLDPMDERLGRLIAYQNAGGSSDISDAISRGLILPDQDKAKRKGPKGVSIQKLKFKYSRGR